MFGNTVKASADQVEKVKLPSSRLKKTPSYSENRKGQNPGNRNGVRQKVLRWRQLEDERGQGKLLLFSVIYS